MRTLSVLKMSKCDEKFLNETDMMGPLLLGFIFGMCLLFVINLLLITRMGKFILDIFMGLDL